jgi:uncharacterized protein YkwD
MVHKRVAALFGGALLAISAICAPLAASPGDSFSARILASHNYERERIGQPSLSWSPQLETQAREWARSLASRGAFEHSRERAGAGENLWMGTAGYYQPEDMIGGFISERRNFRPGQFPNVSRTGNWADVGHYTQLIWPATREVGCAIAEGRGNEVLVCRYFPAGNWVGQRVP